MDAQQLTPEQVRQQQAIVDKAIGYKNDPPLPAVGPYLHSVGGLFNRRDRENPVISAIMSPLMGVADAIPVFNGARDLDNNFGGTDKAFDTIITGVTAGDGDDFDNQPTTDCDDGPEPGNLKLCSIVNTYGNYKHSTKTVYMDRAGRVEDMVDARTISVLNMFPRGLFGVPSGSPSLQNAVMNELAARILTMTVSMQRSFAPRVFIGTPDNNDGEKMDIVGLDIHINAGNKRDAWSGNICTAANSDVKNFGGAVINAQNAPNIMRYIEMADANRTFKARREGLGTPTYKIAMRPELWFELTEVIPVVKYERVLALVNRVTNGRGNVDARDAFEDRNGMRNTHLIPVNGRFIEVVEDDTIPETSSLPSGVPTYASTIYGIPIEAAGTPMTFWEYFNHANRQELSMEQRAGGFTWTTDGGMYRWFASFLNGCIKLNVKFTPRLRMRVTQLAWRIDNVACQPLQHFNSWDPSSAYHVDGGVETGDSSLYYSSWSATPS